MTRQRSAAAVTPGLRPKSTLDRRSAGPITVGLFRSPPELITLSMRRYGLELAEAIERLGRGDVSLDWVQPRRSATAELLGGRGAPFPVRFWRRFASATLTARRSGFVVNHVLDHANAHLVYGLDRKTTVVMCHDIFRLKLWRGEIPGMSRSSRPPLTFMLSLSALKHAGAVITSTAATRDDLIGVLGVPEQRISVIPYGVGDAFAQPRDVPSHPDEGRAILVVDTGAPYKNQRAVIEVLARVRRTIGPAVRLLHVGAPLPPQLMRRAEALGMAGAIEELGPVGTEQMAKIYRRASLLLFPSYYEGFGWPPLEAMASGVPVVCSTAAAVNEVVAGAALQADPDDHQTLAEHVSAVLSDDVLASSLRERGLARVATFTWARAATSTLEVYERLLGGSGP